MDAPPVSHNDTSAEQGIPFYVYDFAPFNIYQQMEQMDEGNSLEMLRKYRYFKHGAEIFWLDAVLKHPWRVAESDWQRARLFVLPFPIGFCAWNWLRPCGDIAKAIKALPGHYTYERAKDRMLLLSTDWGAKLPEPLPNTIFATQVASWGNRIGQRCTVVVPTNTQMRRWRPSSFEEFSARPIRTMFIGQIDWRQAYQDRRDVEAAMREVASLELAERGNSSGGHVDVYAITTDDASRKPCAELCSTGPPGCVGCKITQAAGPYEDMMKLSKWAWHIRGDTAQSNRLYDILYNGALPLVASPDMLNDSLPFPERVPWDDIVKATPWPLKVAEGAAYVSSLHDERRRWELVRHHAPDLVWQLDAQRVTSNVLLSTARSCSGV